MKTIFRFLNSGLLVAAFTAVGAISGFAQTPAADCTAVDTSLRESYGVFSKDIDAKTGFKNATIEQKQSAISAGKEFLENFDKNAACQASWTAQATYVKASVPALERIVTEAPRVAILDRFDTAVNAKKWDDAFAAANEFVSKYPNDPVQTNIIIPLAYVGVIESDKSNLKYNDDSIKYAKMVVSKLNAGEKPLKGDLYGSLGFGGTRDDVISDLNYAIAYLTSHIRKDKVGALPYYYEVAQKPGRKQKEPRVYAAIADYYLEKRKPIGAEIAALIAEQKAASADDDKLAIDAKIKAKIALAKGYIEREMDALSRARAVTPDTPATKAYRDGLYTELKSLYEQRFEKKDGLDPYIAATIAKPMPNPTTDVTPVVEAAPVTTTGTATPAVAPAKVSANTKP